METRLLIKFEMRENEKENQPERMERKKKREQERKQVKDTVKKNTTTHTNAQKQEDNIQNKRKNFIIKKRQEQGEERKV